MHRCRPPLGPKRTRRVTSVWFRSGPSVTPAPYPGGGIPRKSQQSSISFHTPYVLHCCNNIYIYMNIYIYIYSYTDIYIYTYSYIYIFIYRYIYIYTYIYIFIYRYIYIYTHNIHTALFGMIFIMTVRKFFWRIGMIYRDESNMGCSWPQLADFLRAHQCTNLRPDLSYSYTLGKPKNNALHGLSNFFLGWFTQFKCCLDMFRRSPAKKLQP